MPEKRFCKELFKRTQSKNHDYKEHDNVENVHEEIISNIDSLACIRYCFVSGPIV